MPGLRQLQRTIRHTEDLQSVVATMKSLAAVSIRDYQQAADALDEYAETVRLALRALFRRPDAPRPRPTPARRGVVVVHGSDQGMCGHFNEAVADHLQDWLQEAEDRGTAWAFLAIGQRVADDLAARDRPPDRILAVPTAAAGARPLVETVLTDLLERRENNRLDRLVLAYNAYAGGADYHPRTEELLPLDRAWLDRLAAEPWPTNQLPIWHRPDREVLALLVREHLFVALYRALFNSLAGENASRLAAMQAADKNIEERLDDLNHRYHRQRQQKITEELHDITSGFAALKGKQ